MTLHEPFHIGPRLLPALRVGDGVLSLEFAGCVGDRMVFRWYADLPSGEYSGADLRSGVQGATTQAMFGSLLAFLDAAAESYAYGLRTGRPGENADLFPAPVVEWAYQHADELGSRLELEETVLIDE